MVRMLHPGQQLRANLTGMQVGSGVFHAPVTRGCLEKVVRSREARKYWLPPRDSNPDMLIQSQLSYH